MFKKARFLIGIAISLFFLYLVLRRVNAGEFFAALKAMKWQYMIVGIAFSAADKKQLDDLEHVAVSRLGR